MSFDYYKNLKESGAYFVSHETTFSEYTKRLGYHKLLARSLKKRKIDFSKVLEIGGGIGSLKRELIQESNFFVSLDLSLGLLGQQSVFGRNNVLGNALKLPFKDEVFSFIILNEVIADFIPKDLPALIKELRRVLIKGGKIFLSEYGEGESKKVVLKGHTEYSVDFEKLTRISEGLGFKTSIEGLMSFIKLKDDLVVSQKGVQALIEKGFDRRMGEFIPLKSLKLEERLYLTKISEYQALEEGKLVSKKKNFYHNISALGDQFKAVLLELS